ncbi:hypothetical protein QIH77_02900 [Bradyrhizobium diazoefficiens]|uniref:GAP1-N1 domain-containing protein n=1 Tax=Bradyrhizobium diazoefficiens TaxID=1355477 RepID=UPI00272CC4F9|nr:hypothetical protein [Bradyrhizobium diazoefficiens]WLA74202.1 hypothetical protein QIH77_02900 [Bradyrhizobium diazoefficiens]
MTSKIDHALFGYAEGHRQLASTLRLPSQDLYHLGAASDLASDVRLDPSESYVTGLPLHDSRRYALIRTWPAPEMPRPGCVWSHVLLLDEAALSTQRDMSTFFALFRNPKQTDRGFYTVPISSMPTVGSEVVAPSDLVVETLESYYARETAFLNAGVAAEQIEAAIAAVWSQQWPKLRAGFSFRTARLGSTRRRNARYDVQVAPAESPRTTAPSGWAVAAASDASSPVVTPLRRFLWRYGRDVQDPRDRFRLLVETYLAAAGSERLPMTAAIEVFDRLKGDDDGLILKNDILGFGTSSLSICPPVSFLDMLRLLDARGSDAVVDIEEVGRRFERLPVGEAIEVANFAAADGNGLDRLREPIFAWTVARADDGMVDAVRSPALRARILTTRPDLITGRAITDLSGAELAGLFEVCGTEEARKTVVETAVRRDLGEAAADILSRSPETTGGAAIDADLAGELHDAWRRPVANARDALLATDLLSRAGSLSDVLAIANLLGLTRGVFAVGRSAANWSSRWHSLRRDVSEQIMSDIEAELFSAALNEAGQGGWDLIAAVLPELRGTINRQPLGGEGRRTLDRSLPYLGYDNWDLNRRMLLALHAMYRRTPTPDELLFRAGLSEAEAEFVRTGPKEEPKKKVGLFWWLG